MKIKKYNENIEEYDILTEISEMFLEMCDNFSGDDEVQRHNEKILLFYFPVVDDEEINQIYKLKNFLDNNYKYFYLNMNHSTKNIVLNVSLENNHQQQIIEKLKILKNSNKYNL